jgi:hypothetical protein
VSSRPGVYAVVTNGGGVFLTPAAPRASGPADLTPRPGYARAAPVRAPRSPWGTAPPPPARGPSAAIIRRRRAVTRAPSDLTSDLPAPSSATSRSGSLSSQSGRDGPAGVDGAGDGRAALLRTWARRAGALSAALGARREPHAATLAVGLRSGAVVLARAALADAGGGRTGVAVWGERELSLGAWGYDTPPGMAGGAVAVAWDARGAALAAQMGVGGVVLWSVTGSQTGATIPPAQSLWAQLQDAGGATLPRGAGSPAPVASLAPLPHSAAPPGGGGAAAPGGGAVCWSGEGYRVVSPPLVLSGHAASLTVLIGHAASLSQVYSRGAGGAAGLGGWVEEAGVVRPSALQAAGGAVGGFGTTMLQGEDRVLVLRPRALQAGGGGGDRGAREGGEGGSWMHVVLPDAFYRDNGPVTRVAADADGRFVAVAGDKGVCVYDVEKLKWRVFGDVTQERALRVAAMAWCRPGVLTVACAAPEGSELLLLDAQRLDLHRALARVRLRALPCTLDARGDCLVVIDQAGVLSTYRVARAGEHAGAAAGAWGADSAGGWLPAMLGGLSVGGGAAGRGAWSPPLPPVLTGHVSSLLPY